MKIITQEYIIKSIQKKIDKNCTYIDAIVDFCNENNLEIESVAEVIKKSQILKEKVRSEGIKLLMVNE